MYIAIGGQILNISIGHPVTLTVEHEPVDWANTGTRTSHPLVSWHPHRK